MNNLLYLNLGCGQNKMPGYVNVDKFGDPDVRHDLETFPWPWPDNSVGKIVLNHCLEHLGSTIPIYFGIIQEMYRICVPDAQIHIWVPHPRHDDFLTDPTHVRIITPNSLKLFSKKLNHKWKTENCANSPLGLYLDVDFDVIGYSYSLEANWKQKVEDGELTDKELFQAIQKYNNVVKEIQIVLKTVKK